MQFTPDGTRAVVLAGSAYRVFGQDAALIDAATDTVVAIISLQFGGLSTGLAMSSDSSNVYFTGGSGGTAALAVVPAKVAQTSSLVTPSRKIALSKRPGAMALVTAAKAYVALRGSSSETDEIAVVDLVNGQKTKAIDLGKDASPAAFAVSTASKVYVANRRSATVTVIDSSTDAIDGAPITFQRQSLAFLGDGPVSLLLSPNGTDLIVARSFRAFDVNGTYQRVDTGLFSEFFTSSDLPCYAVEGGDLDGREISVVSLATRTVTRDIVVGRAPVGVILANDGKNYYVASNCDPVMNSIDATTFSSESIALAGRTVGMVATTDGTKIYLAHVDSVSEFTTATKALVPIEPRGTGAPVLVYQPFQPLLYAIRPALKRVDVIDVNAPQTPTIAKVSTPARPGRAFIAGGDIVHVLNTGTPGSPGSTITRIIGPTEFPSVDLVQDGPMSAAVSPDGDSAFITMFGDLDMVLSNQPDLREGFGHTIATVSPVVAQNPPVQTIDGDAGFSSTPQITGPLDSVTIAAVPDGFGGSDWLAYSNFTLGRVNALNLTFPGNERHIDVPFPPTRLAAVPPSASLSTPNLLLVLSLEPALVSMNFEALADVGGFDFNSCDFRPTPDATKCIVYDLAKPPTSVSVGPPVGGIPSVVVATFDDDKIYVFRYQDLAPTVPNATADAATHALAVGKGPVDALVTRDGLTAYVANQLDDTISVVDLGNPVRVVSTLAAGDGPTTVIEDDTGRVFVGYLYSNTVTVIRNRAIVSTISLEN